jgi:hypothetical protein
MSHTSSKTQKAYNGVAILSRHPMEAIAKALVETIPTAPETCAYGNPNAYTALPAAIATYSFPSTAKAMGAA